MVFLNFLRKNSRIPEILSFAGMMVTSYLIYQHYKDPGSSFCNVSDYVSCDIVNKSVYSEIFGIPVSILGFLAYLIIFFASIALKKNKKILGPLTLFAGFSFLFALYLTFVEFFILKAVCILCITQQIIILLLFLIFLLLWRSSRKSLHSPHLPL